MNIVKRKWGDKGVGDRSGIINSLCVNLFDTHLTFIHDSTYIYFLCQVFHITSIEIFVWNGLHIMYKYTLQAIWIRFNMIIRHLWLWNPGFIYNIMFYIDKKDFTKKVFHITSMTSYQDMIPSHVWSENFPKKTHICDQT